MNFIFAKNYGFNIEGVQIWPTLSVLNFRHAFFDV